LSEGWEEDFAAQKRENTVDKLKRKRFSIFEKKGALRLHFRRKRLGRWNRENAILYIK